VVLVDDVVVAVLVDDVVVALLSLLLFLLLS